MKLDRLFSAIASLLSLGAIAVSPVFSQTPNKVVGWSKSPIGSNNETAAPDLLLSRQINGVQIEGIVVGGNSITVGVPFAADDDWLRNFTVRVRNISGQRLVGIQLTLVLPEMKVSPQIWFCYPCIVGEKGKSVMPGEEVTLIMPAGAFYDWVRIEIAKERAMSQITKAEIRAMYVTLPDGPKWFSGCVKTADPKNGCPNHGAP